MFTGRRPFTGLNKTSSHRRRPWLSVVIPTLNEVDTLPVCVNALLGVLPESELEIIVADGGSTDGTVDYVAAHPRLKNVPGTSGRARQLNAGAALAQGEFLWFLHADTVPPGGWLLYLRLAAQGSVPACFSLNFAGQENSSALRFYARGSRWPYWWVRFGDQSLFVAREQFVRSGGYREDHVLMEGHEMVRRLTRQCGGFRVLPAAVTTSSRRYKLYGTVYTQLVFVLIVVLYYLGLPQAALAKIYRKAFPQRRAQVVNADHSR